MILSINNRCKGKDTANFTNVGETLRLKKRASQNCDIPTKVTIENSSTVNIVMFHPIILTVPLCLRDSLNLQK